MLLRRCLGGRALGHHDVLPQSMTQYLWNREDVQRVLFNIVSKWDTFGDSELFRDAIRIGRETLKDNNWWPDGS